MTKIEKTLHDQPRPPLEVPGFVSAFEGARRALAGNTPLGKSYREYLARNAAEKVAAVPRDGSAGQDDQFLKQGTST